MTDKQFWSLLISLGWWFLMLYLKLDRIAKVLETNLPDDDGDDDGGGEPMPKPEEMQEAA